MFDILLLFVFFNNYIKSKVKCELCKLLVDSSFLVFPVFLLYFSGAAGGIESKLD